MPRSIRFAFPMRWRNPPCPNHRRFDRLQISECVFFSLDVQGWCSANGVELEISRTETKMKSNIFAFSVSFCVAMLTCGVGSAQEVKTKTKPSEAKASKATKDIVDTAVAADDFKTLAKALKAADLVETLKGKGPFTVFAPTDAAFAKLPKETLADLLKPANKAKLANILTYHVLPKKKVGSDLSEMKKAVTVQGSQLKITMKKGKMMVGKAHVGKSDIMCSNGVIHVIDTVLMPE